MLVYYALIDHLFSSYLAYRQYRLVVLNHIPSLIKFIQLIILQISPQSLTTCVFAFLSFNQHLYCLLIFLELVLFSQDGSLLGTCQVFIHTHHFSMGSLLSQAKAIFIRTKSSAFLISSLLSVSQAVQAMTICSAVSNSPL